MKSQTIKRARARARARARERERTTYRTNGRFSSESEYEYIPQEKTHQTHKRISRERERDSRKSLVFTICNACLAAMHSVSHAFFFQSGAVYLDGASVVWTDTNPLGIGVCLSIAVGIRVCF